MKRALIIAYYWPPAGGPGVQRWLKFVTYFKEFGITPVVYIPENPHYPLVDESFMMDVPSVEIIKTPIKEPYRFARLLSKKRTNKISSGIITKRKQTFLEKIMLWVRGNFFIPDARIGWVKPSVAYLENYLTNNPVDVIITTGPPHSLHLIGMQLKKTLNLPWLTDFRDPWTTIHYHKALRLSVSSKRKHKKLESQVLNNCDQVVVTSPTAKVEFEGLTNTPIEVITNGYEISEEEIVSFDESFSIVHVGSLLSERNPNVLWKVLSRLCEEHSEIAKNLVIKLVGAVSNDIVESIREHGLGDALELIGYVPHEDAIKFQRKAQLLLLVEIDTPETRAIIPGKLFEYLAARRPIVALGPEASDIETILNETQSGSFHSYQEETQLYLTLQASYNQYKNDLLLVDSKGIEKYSRKALTETMSNTIFKMLK